MKTFFGVVALSISFTVAVALIWANSARKKMLDDDDWWNDSY